VSEKDRTGWRDQELSERRRTWGVRGSRHNLAAVDVDDVPGEFILVEYDAAEPLAVIEFKLRTDPQGAKSPKLDHPNYKVLAKLARGYRWKPQGLPFVVVYYAKDPWRFSVVAIDLELREPRTLLTERDYVASLHKLRGWSLPDAVAAKLENTLGKDALAPDAAFGTCSYSKKHKAHHGPHPETGRPICWLCHPPTTSPET
jgi:hypothetical protein